MRVDGSRKVVVCKERESECMCGELIGSAIMNGGWKEQDILPPSLFWVWRRRPSWS